MKTTLLSFLLFAPSLLIAQSITGFFSEPSSEYAVVATVSPLDQSASGEDASWSFLNLMATSVTSIDTYSNVNEGNPIRDDYPLTNFAQTTTDSNTQVANLYVDSGSAKVDITGIESMGLALQYNDLGVIGDFPLAYNFSNGGNSIAGAFNFSGTSGTFTGTITTTVDAYGTLSMNDVGGGTYSGTVTRLKIIQDIDLFVGFKVGDLTQTSHYYYDNGTGNLVFRSNQIQITSALIDDVDFTLMESLIVNPLSVSDSKNIAEPFNLTSNPVAHTLSFQLNKDVNVSDVLIYDLQGRQVLQSQFKEQIDVTALVSGIYVLALKTDNGLLSKKFVKR